SPNTLMRMVEAWWSELAERLAAQARADVPGIPEPVQRVMQVLWSEAVVTARKLADSRVAEREQQADARTRDSDNRQAEGQSKLAAAAQAQQAAESALAAEQQRAGQLQSALTDALGTVKDTQTTLEALRRTGDDERARLRTDLERAAATQD